MKQLRLSLGLSQKVVAELAGISAPYLSQLERGVRAFDRLWLVEHLAAALGVAPSELAGLGIPSPGNGRTDNAVELVREVLLGVELGYPGGEVVPVEALRDRVTAAQHTRYSAGFTELGALLPDLIKDLHTTLNAGRDVAKLLDITVLCHVNVTCMWLRDAWAPTDLRLKAATLARELAHRRGEDNPVTLALGAWGSAHTLLATGHTGFARAELSSVRLPTGRAPGLAGSLLIKNAHVATSEGHHQESAVIMAEAREFAASVGEMGLHPLGFAFGPLQVGLQHMKLHLEADNPGAAVRLGRTLTPQAHAYTTRQAAYWLSMGQALARQPRSTGAAVAAFLTAEKLMPVRVRRSPLVAETVAGLAARCVRNAVPTELRGLAQRAGLSL